MENSVKRQIDWHSIAQAISQLPDGGEYGRPFIAGDQIYFFIVRDNRPSYLMRGEFVIRDPRTPEIRWKQVCTVNEVGRALQQHHYNCPEWLANYASYGRVY